MGKYMSPRWPSIEKPRLLIYRVHEGGASPEQLLLHTTTTNHFLQHQDIATGPPLLGFFPRSLNPHAWACDFSKSELTDNEERISAG